MKCVCGSGLVSLRVLMAAVVTYNSNSYSSKIPKTQVRIEYNV